MRKITMRVTKDDMKIVEKINRACAEIINTDISSKSSYTQIRTLLYTVCDSFDFETSIEKIVTEIMTNLDTKKYMINSLTTYNFISEDTINAIEQKQSPNEQARDLIIILKEKLTLNKSSSKNLYLVQQFILLQNFITTVSEIIRKKTLKRTKHESEQIQTEVNGAHGFFNASTTAAANETSDSTLNLNNDSNNEQKTLYL